MDYKSSVCVRETSKVRFLLDKVIQKYIDRDFPGGPVVKNLPYNSVDKSTIPGQGTKIPHASGQQSPCAATTELVCLN